MDISFAPFVSKLVTCFLVCMYVLLYVSPCVLFVLNVIQSAFNREMVLQTIERGGGGRLIPRIFRIPDELERSVSIKKFSEGKELKQKTIRRRPGKQR